MKHTDSPRCSRRAVLKGLGLLAGGLALAPTLHVLPALAAPALKKSTETRLLLGTLVEMTALAPSADQAREAMDHAFADIQRLTAIFSRFDHGAALAVLNAHGRLDHAPQDLLTVLDHSRQLTRQSNGAFDMTIAPVVALLERSHGSPDPAELREALELVDASRLRQEAGSLRLDASGMAVTLDGIAKGYIADCAADILRRHGVAHFCLNAGGDIRVQGSPEGRPGGRPWRVAIEDPAKHQDYPDVLNLADGAVATSGGYEIFFNAEKSAHHLVDPATGRSPRQIRSVSVQAPTVMQADGLATALSVMPPRQAMALVAMLPRHECLLLTADGGRLSTPGWGRQRV